MATILIENFVRQLKELQDGSLWFDQCLKDKLDSLSDAIAFARPHKAVHSVAEHVSHMLAWRKECILRFTGSKTDLMNAPNDWIPNQALQNIGWTALRNNLYDSTQAMIELIQGKEDSYLDTVFQDTDYTFKYLIEGIFEHDIYHLGQIGVTLKLLQATT